MRKVEFNCNLASIKADTFSEIYPLINKFIMDNKEWEPSRDGNVKEVLDFKTIITNPYRRLVGGYNRNINPFFLFAEAMWIFTGRKDVRFLSLFNKNMEKYSDDGKVFHAPYGFRLRHWGVRSEDKFCEENLHAAQGYDQIADAIKLFENNLNTRQIVLSIWNPDLDLGTKTNDIPCNDIVMLKVRDGKLITTIQNRSNDLHWGLPTNVFQFSFITELIAACLNLKLGTQTHNSQSLHIYEWNEIATRMLSCDGNQLYNDSNELYSEAGAKEMPIDFNFSHEFAGNRLREIDYNLNVILYNLEKISRGGDEIEEEINNVRDFSKYLYAVYQLLKVYLKYKIAISDNKECKQDEAIKAIESIDTISNGIDDWDVIVMSKNWFAKKISNYNHAFIGHM
jgi:thymidylate synthase